MELVDVYDGGGIPRAAGQNLSQMEESQIAYVVESRSQADRLFSNSEHVLDQTWEDMEAFLDDTNFESEVLLQIEDVVANSAIEMVLTAFVIEHATGVAEYETRENESAGGAASASSVNQLLLRVDVARGDIESFEVRTGEQSFEPTTVDSLLSG